MKVFISKDLRDTERYAAEWLDSLESSEDEALVVGLSGHLGAGKTAFVKMVGKALGVEEEITSPTFVIMKIYETKNERFPRLVHIDAYRLERPEEMEALDFERFAADPRNLIMVEWPENVSLKTKIAISFQADGDGEFRIEQRSPDHM